MAEAVTDLGFSSMTWLCSVLPHPLQCVKCIKSESNGAAKRWHSMDGGIGGQWPLSNGYKIVLYITSIAKSTAGLNICQK